MERKHAHYFRSVANLTEIDLYRFFDLFGVTDQALGHAIKKLVVPGMRGGGKPARVDIQEAIDTLQRRLEMMDEDARLVEVEPEAAPGPAAFSASMLPPGWTANTGEFALPPLVRAGVPTEVMFRDGSVLKTSVPEGMQWSLIGTAYDIVAWRFAAKVAGHGF